GQGSPHSSAKRPAALRQPPHGRSAGAAYERARGAGPNRAAAGKLGDMSLARTLLRFLFLAAIGHQVTYTFVEGGIFEDTRETLGRLHPKVDEFVRCHLCVGTWIGAMLAAVYRPNLLADVDVKRPGVFRQAAN